MGDEKRGKERPERKNAKTKRRDKDKEENEEEKKEKDNERRKERRKDTGRTTKKKKRKEKKRRVEGPSAFHGSGLRGLYVRRDQKDPVHLAPDLEPAPLACSRVDRRQKGGLRVPGQPARAATRNVL